jgi:hypothetical protein
VGKAAVAVVAGGIVLVVVAVVGWRLFVADRTYDPHSPLAAHRPV